MKDNGVQPASFQWRHVAVQLLAFFLAAVLVSLLLYAPVLRSFFVFDDLSVLSIVGSGGGSWVQCIVPMSNGFWRPSHLILARVLLDVFGLSPVAFHLAAICVHAAVVTLTACLGMRLFPGRRDIAFSGALLFTAHVGAWGCVSVYQNSCDSFLALSALGALLIWDSYLLSGSRRLLWGVAVLFVFALMGKETAVLLPFVLFVWSVFRQKAALVKRELLAFGAAGLGFAAVGYLLQLSAERSYVRSGVVRLSLVLFVRQFADYSISLIIPYLHTMKAPFYHPELGSKTLWVLRGLTWMAVGAAAWLFVSRPKHRRLLVLPMCAVSWLLLAGLKAGSPEQRYLYVALPFVSLFVAAAACKVRGLWKLVVRGAVALGWVWSIMGFYASETVLCYRRQAYEVSNCVGEMRRLSPQWPEGAVVTILNHPHPGPDPWRWVYCQHLARIFLPERHVQIALEPCGSPYCYRFENGCLVAQRDLAEAKP